MSCQGDRGVEAATIKVVECSPDHRYERYDHLLGKGACKRVYRAIDTHDGREVAWNQVDLGSAESEEDDQMREHLFGEITVLQKMWHKNIMTFFCWWFNPETNVVNFITEMFSSGTLRQYRKRCRHVSDLVIKRWAWQICEGLVYLHGHSPPIVHRDLKCDNIFINGCTGQVKIGDLGLATAQRGLSVVGTPEFMAPEVYEEQYDEKVDIYSFGMCLLELATCEYPYRECRNLAQIYRKVTKGIPPDALARVESEPLQELIRLCTQLEPSMRPSARKLLKHPFFDSLRSGQPACVYTPYDMTCRSPSGNVRRVMTCGAFLTTSAAANGTSTAAYLSALSSPIAGGGGTTPKSTPTTFTSFGTVSASLGATANAGEPASEAAAGVMVASLAPRAGSLALPDWLGPGPIGGLSACPDPAVAAAAADAMRVTQVTYREPDTSAVTIHSAAVSRPESSPHAAAAPDASPELLEGVAASAPSFAFSPPSCPSPIAAAAAADMWGAFGPRPPLTAAGPWPHASISNTEDSPGAEALAQVLDTANTTAAAATSTTSATAGQTMVTTTCSDSAGLVWARAGSTLLQGADSLGLGWLEEGDGSAGGGGGGGPLSLEEDMSLQCDLAAVGRDKVEVPLDVEDLHLMVAGGSGGGGDDGGCSSESSEEVILPLEYLQEEGDDQDGDMHQQRAPLALAQASSGRLPAASALSFRLGWLAGTADSATSDCPPPQFPAMDQISTSTRRSSMSCSVLRYKPADGMSNSASSSFTAGVPPSARVNSGAAQGVWGVQPAVYGIITRLKKSHPLLQDGAADPRTHSI